MRSTDKGNEKAVGVYSSDHSSSKEGSIHGDRVDVQEGTINDNVDDLQRHLGNRQIQLIAIGGSIGTAIFVSIGSGLARGGPGSLFLAYFIYSCFLGLVNNCIAEMTVAFPVSGGFIRLAGKWVDDAFGFMAGWNFFFMEALLIPFEITALTTVISFWSADITNAGPTAGIAAACILLYAAINMLAVKAYGEAEFWLSGGKVILIFSLFFFTFITMVGGNPAGDAYGFRFWQNPGAFAEYLSTGATGRFEGFLACLWSAAFTVVGPEYISMVAAEARRPRVYVKTAFKTVYFRFALFFVGGATCVGIVCAYNDPALVAVVTGTSAGGGTAAASPYVIAMQNLGITGFPHVVNALLCTSIFSAGNTYTYCAVRSLYGLALEGRAPKILTRATKKGVPIYCFFIVMLFPLLSFLQVSSGSAVVLNWLIALITASALINYIVMCATFIFFYNACKAQGLDRKLLPYFGRFQPYCAYIGLAWECLMVITFGYSSFRNGFNVSAFFQSYTMVLISPCLFVGWKLIKKTKMVKSLEADLVWERPIIDAYEATIVSPPVGFWREMLQLVGIGRVKGGNDQRADSVIA